MGKIYDALKRAEKEAQTNKEKIDITEARHQTGKEELHNTMHNSSTSNSSIDTVKQTSRVISQKLPAQKVPALKLLSEESTAKKASKKGLGLFNIFTRKDVSNESTPLNLFVSDDPNSIAAEQFRILKTRILSFCKEKTLRTLLVTSCFPGEGKTTIASNLSISIANSINQDALLIDCDLRRPSIHKCFNISNTAGLADYLTNNIKLDQALVKTSIEKLTILPAGTVPSNPYELLSSDKMTSLLHEVKRQYDDRYIILDSAPLYQTPDSFSLIDNIDGIILAVKSGDSNREVIKKTIDLLDQKKIIGIVFNMAQEHLKTYYYNYTYTKQTL